MISLATCVDGRTLLYDATLYEFRLERDLVSYADVSALDKHAHLHWNAPEQRDWFRKINPADLDRCNRRALNRHGNGFSGLSPEEQVQADAKRDDSVLAGKIVDADPALVRAVADALEEQGLLGRGGGAPQTVIGMPAGMESLSQLQKQEGRKMTMMEHYLMRQILKNDDKEKSRREKREAEMRAKAEKTVAKEKKELESTSKISRAQKRVATRDRDEERSVKEYSDKALKAHSAYRADSAGSGGMSIDQALAAVEMGTASRVQGQGGGYGAYPGQQQAVAYYDSYGNPLRPEPDAMLPSMGQRAYAVSEEEKALTEMRERNLARQSQYTMASSDVPGMDAAASATRARASTATRSTPTER